MIFAFVYYMKSSRKFTITKLVFGIAIFTLLFLSSCAGARKCNGGRGTQTDMGTM